MISILERPNIIQFYRQVYMKENEFDLKDFRNHLQQLETELSAGIEQDADYQGEIDEVVSSLKRLSKELEDTKYQQVLPDLFRVLEFLDMIEDNFDDEEEEEEEEDSDES